MPDWMTREGIDDLRRAPSRDQQVERHRWLIAAVSALGVGVANYIGLQFAGLPVRDSLLIAVGLVVLLVAAYAFVSFTSPKPVLPVPRQGEPPLNETEPLLEFPTRAMAAEEATRRNLELAEEGEFWKPEQLANGHWGLRHRRVGKPGDTRQSWFDRLLNLLGS